MHQLLMLAATLAVLLALSGIVPLLFVDIAPADDVKASGVAALASAPETPSHSIGDGGVQTGEIEALTLDSDFTGFVKRDCPLDRHRAGLRKLWSLMPAEPVAENSAV